MSVLYQYESLLLSFEVDLLLTQLPFCAFENNEN